MCEEALHMSILLPPPSESLTELQEIADFREAMLDSLPAIVVVYEAVTPTEFRFIASNKVGYEASGFTTDDVGRTLTDLFPPEQAKETGERFQKCLATNAPLEAEECFSVPNGLNWVHSIYRPLPPAPGKPQRVLMCMFDINARKRLELEQRERQEEIIEQQAAQLAELSTPLLAISERTVVMPLIGAIDSRRIQQIMDSLLTGVAAQRAAWVILDITGVPIVDTQVANALVRAAHSVRLLGAQVVLTGIRPEVAQTLVGLGVDLSSIITRGTLRDGIAHAN
jgi:rsbT co-antagonist protein RsbR